MTAECLAICGATFSFGVALGAGCMFLAFARDSNVVTLGENQMVVDTEKFMEVSAAVAKMDAKSLRGGGRAVRRQEAAVVEEDDDDDDEYEDAEA